jgi:hypothetical protein
MKRGVWLALLLSLAAGLAGGLAYAWLAYPATASDSDPASLRPEFQEDYLALIASAYVASGDLQQAQTRLALFPDLNLPETLAALAQKRLAENAPLSETRALAELASALGALPSQPVTMLTQTAAAEALPTTPTPQPPALPTATPTPIPGTLLHLTSLRKICDPELGSPLIQVYTYDSDGAPLPGIEVDIIWDNGQDRILTGLKPELGLAYADFVMQEETLYNIQIVGSQEPIIGLLAETCSAEGTTFPGSWRAVFEISP